MTRLGTVAVSFLLAGRLAIGQAQPPNASDQAVPSTADQHSQTDNSASEVPMFRAHARQVLVTASVRKNTAKSVPEEVLKRHPGERDVFAVRPAAQGLSSNDFRIFDNGAEQRINYFEEFDSSWRDLNGQWVFYPHVRGVWGNFLSFALERASAIYVIGYAPPVLQSGDCHTIRVVAGDNEVVLNRSGYCNTDEDSTAGDGGKLAVQMEDFARSGKPGSINVMSRAFVFWSSRVLSLRGDKSRHDVGSVSGSAPNGSSYVEAVHDPKAPATVQIATEYRLERRFWDYPCPKNHPAISVLGVVYQAGGDVAARFGDRYSCVQRGYYPTGFEPPPGAKAGTIQIPSRFNTAVELRPGDYVVHVVVSDGHNFGQAQMPLRVEAIASQALATSDIAANGILRDASSLLRDAAMVSPLPLVPAPGKRRLQNRDTSLGFDGSSCRVAVGQVRNSVVSTAGDTNLDPPS